MTKKIPDHTTIRLLRLTAMISGVFSLLVCLLIIINFFQLKNSDPLNTEVLSRLHEQFIKDPGNLELQQEIRQIDLMARKAFFTSRWQIRTGGYLLIAGVILVIICLKIIEMITPKIPEIPVSSVTGVKKPRRLNRNWFIVAGAIFVTGALILAWLTHRILPGLPEESVSLNPLIKKIDSSSVLQQNADSNSVLLTDTSAYQKTSDSSGMVSPDGFPTMAEIRLNFPSFRGPFGNGVAFQKNIPVTWDGNSGKNIKWKTEIPLPGFNSPIVWESKIFLSGAKEARKEVYCLDNESGKMLWKTDLSTISETSKQSPKVIPETGLAAPSMTTDGRRVYVIFATGDLAALDFSGKILWNKSLGIPKNHYGHSSSLIMFRDLLIVQYDQTGNARVMALSGKTGEKVWETQRKVKVSWASPVLMNTGLGTELVLAAEPDVTGYDPATGKELWKIDCISGEVGPSITYTTGMFFSINEYSKLAAVKTGRPPVLVWEDDEYLPDVPSPVAFNDLLFVLTSYGVIVCYDAATGKRHWVKELDKTVYASPMIAEGKLFIIDKSGVMHIFKADKTLTEIAESPLGEGSSCTPAFSEGRIFIRGNKHLFCISK